MDYLQNRLICLTTNGRIINKVSRNRDSYSLEDNMIATEEKPLPDQTLKTTFTFNIPAQYIQILQTSSLLTSVIPNFVLGFVPPNESENNIQIS